MPTVPPLPQPPLRFGVALDVVGARAGVRETARRETRRCLRALSLLLGDALGCEVRGRIAVSYPRLLDAMRAREIDVAWLPPVLALRAASAGAAIPIALPVRNGSATFHTALVARADSAVKRPRDLAGVAVGWVDPQSASGYIVIRAALRAAGVDVDYGFRSQQQLGSHAAVSEALRRGDIDVGATFLHEAPDGTLSGGWGELAVRVVMRVGPIPNDVLCAGVHVPVERVRAVQHGLVNDPRVVAAANELLEAEGLVPATSAHLDGLIRLLAYLDTGDAKPSAERSGGTRVDGSSPLRGDRGG